MPFVIEKETTYVSVGTTSSEILPKQNNRTFLHIQNSSATTIYIRFGDTDAVADTTSIKIVSGGELTIENPGTGAVQAIGAAAGLLTVTLQKVLLGNRNITDFISANNAYADFSSTITLSGDYRAEITANVKTATDSKFMGGDSSSDNGLWGVDDTGAMVLFISSAWRILGNVGFDPSLKVHRYAIERVGSVITGYVIDDEDNPTTVGTYNYSGDVKIANLGRAGESGSFLYSDSDYLDFKVWDDGVLVIDCDLEDDGDSSTFNNKVSGGVTLTKVNIAEGDTDNYREKLDSYVSSSTTIFKA